MKKIVFVNSGMGIGGVERVISIWANYFIKKYNVEIITETLEKSFYTLNSEIKRSTLNYYINIRFLPFWRLYVMYKFLKDRKGEIIIFNKYRHVTSIYLLRKLGLFKQIKLVYFSHGDVYDFNSFYSKNKTNKIFYSFDEIICLYKGTNENKEKNKNINLKKISLIPNPVSFKVIEKANLTNKTVIFVGRVSEYVKGLDFLIEAWEITSKLNPDWSLEIIGEGEDKESIISLVKKKKLCKSIKFISAKNNIEDYYKQASILVVPSRYEGMPMVVLEGMEAGLPIVSFEIDALKSLIKNKENGFKSPKYNVEKYAENLGLLMRDYNLRKEIGNKNSIKAKEFGIESRIKLWNKILGE